MKKWITKVKLPGYEKGEVLKFDFCNSNSRIQVYWYGFWVELEDFPDLFECVEVKSDSELLGDYFHTFVCCVAGEKGCSSTADSLLSQNAINPEFIEKLRKGSK